MKEISGKVRVSVLLVSFLVLLFIAGGTDTRHELDFTWWQQVLLVVAVLAGVVAGFDDLYDLVSGLFHRVVHPVRSDARKAKR